MQCTTRGTDRQWGMIVHTVAVLGLVALAVSGIAMESNGGWIACPPRVIVLGERRQERRQGKRCRGVNWRAAWAWMRCSWAVAAVRSEVLWLLVIASERWEWEMVCLLPWLAWVWKGVGIGWPALGRWSVWAGIGRALEWASRVALIGMGAVCVVEYLVEVSRYGAGIGLVGGCLCEPAVEVEQDEEGRYHVCLRGTFELCVDGRVEFYKRMLVVFLGLLEVAGESRGSRRTRDGRTPFVREAQQAAWFQVPQAVISRWYRYWLEQDWGRMLSLRQSDVLTLDMRQRVIAAWVKFPQWTAERLHQHLRAQGSAITLRQVKQIGQESGWTTLRQELERVYHMDAESFRPRDEWLVRQLLAQVEELVAQLEAIGGLTPEQEVVLSDTEALCQELTLHPARPHRPLPWMLRLERLLFGHWEWVDDGSVRCTYCGTTHVSRKSKQPRLKRYMDEQGRIQKVEVYRYYCHNPACKYKTFTRLPAHLLPHSQWSIHHHLAALQQYEWSHSIYRCTAQMLGVCKMTTYRWVSAFGYQLLPVAALFGAVRSSGVVGVDEKYVLVSKNDKPDEKMKRWMYVYVAVDCYTYDLLHIDIYPYNSKDSARAFLLALRAKGYHPRVIVTDMRTDYSDVVARVFPKAIHHECIFHALQQVHHSFKEIYGRDYAQHHPAAKALQEEIDAIFDAATRRTAQRRFEQVMSQRELFVAATPEAEAIFAFLERHWPRLVNAIESSLVPSTNNATEQVIRIFNQHYKTFCGFENIESARLYLAVFEKVYRFSPFSNDAQERIRGKCPLELAGYEVQKLPMAQLFRGLALQWPAAAFEELVPNV